MPVAQEIAKARQSQPGESALASSEIKTNNDITAASEPIKPVGITSTKPEHTPKKPEIDKGQQATIKDEFSQRDKMMSQELFGTESIPKTENHNKQQIATDGGQHQISDIEARVIKDLLDKANQTQTLRPLFSATEPPQNPSKIQIISANIK